MWRSGQRHRPREDERHASRRRPDPGEWRLVGVVPTKRRYEIDATYWYRLKDGKIADHYAVRDNLKMMQDLGLSPKPPPFNWGAFAARANAGR